MKERGHIRLHDIELNLYKTLKIQNYADRKHHWLSQAEVGIAKRSL